MSTAIEKFRGEIAPVRAQFESVEGTKLTFDKEIGFAVQILAKNNLLAKIASEKPEQLQMAIYNVALTGLSLNPVLKYAYLLPREGNVMLEPSYMGLIKVLTDAGTVKSVRAELVYEGDVFEVYKGTENRILHVPNYAGTQSKVVAVYAIADLAGGLQQFEVMTTAEVERIRARSASYGSGKNSPWLSDSGEMFRKTAIRRLFKYLPKTEVAQAALEALRVFDENNAVENAERNDPAEGIFPEKADEMQSLKDAINVCNNVEGFNYLLSAMRTLPTAEKKELWRIILNRTTDLGILFDATLKKFFMPTAEEVEANL